MEGGAPTPRPWVSWYLFMCLLICVASDTLHELIYQLKDDASVLVLRFIKNLGRASQAPRHPPSSPPRWRSLTQRPGPAPCKLSVSMALALNASRSAILIESAPCCPWLTTARILGPGPGLRWHKAVTGGICSRFKLI